MSDSSEHPQLLLAGFHPLILEDSRIRASAHFDIHAVGSEEDMLLPAVTRLQPNVVLLDLLLTSSLRTIRRVRDLCPSCRVVALTGMRHTDSAHSILSAGASGILYRFSAATELFVAVRTVLSGLQYLSPAFTTSSHELEQYRSPYTGELSPSDKLVLRLIARGYPADRIARSIGQSVATVHLSIACLKRRLGRGTRRGLQQYAVEHDLDSEARLGPSEEYPLRHPWALDGTSNRPYEKSASGLASDREENSH
jgi:DNA-binding NarL/FixJ family response regulator